MDFTNSFSVPRPVDEVWQTVLDLAKVVPLVPNATVLDGSGKRVTAQIKIRLGSMTMQYTGPAEVTERYDAQHRAVMTASAREKGGQGTADARVELQLSPAGGSTSGTLKSTINVMGKAAQMGSGTIVPVTEALIQGFAANLAKM
jgi:carbon monoxide dehydrogenase subunit G